MKKAQHVKKIAIIDLDDSLFYNQILGGFLNGDVIDILFRQGHIPMPQMLPLFDLRDNLTNTSFHDYMNTIINIIENKILIGIHTDEIKEAFVQIPNLGSRIIQPVLHTLKSLKKKGYKIIVATAVFNEFQTTLKKYLDFDHYIGIELSINEEGYCIGGSSKNPALTKLVAIDELVEHNNYTWNNSVAFGDSVADIPYLSKATYSFVVNPHPMAATLSVVNKFTVLHRYMNSYYLGEWRDTIFQDVVISPDFVLLK